MQRRPLSPPVAAAMPLSHSVIDRAVLGEWLGDDDDAINALLAEFRDSARSEHQTMVKAISAGDVALYGLAVHRLRGAALSMGANALARAAAVLDAAARANDLVTCRDGMPSLAIQLDLMIANVPPVAAHARGLTEKA